MQSTCTVYIGSQILAVQHTDESNAHEVNKFPKTGKKKKTFQWRRKVPSIH